MAGRVQEVGAAEVFVALRLARPDSAESISTSTDERAGSSGSNSSVPRTFLKCPLTQVTIMCRTANSAEVCPGSIQCASALGAAASALTLCIAGTSTVATTKQMAMTRNTSA